MKMEEHKNIITRLLPKTGQSIEYALGDDGTYEAGWWRGLLLANNKTRFVIKGSGLTAKVIDRATGLMWASNGNGGGGDYGGDNTWAEAIGIANNLSFAGRSDWRIPNIKEWFSLGDFSIMNPAINSTFFPNVGTDKYWSSTTLYHDTNLAFLYNTYYGTIEEAAKVAEHRMLCVRGGL